MRDVLELSGLLTIFTLLYVVVTPLLVWAFNRMFEESNV